jgi:hypothetical protein
MKEVFFSPGNGHWSISRIIYSSGRIFYDKPLVIRSKSSANSMNILIIF